MPFVAYELRGDPRGSLGVVWTGKGSHPIRRSVGGRDRLTLKGWSLGNRHSGSGRHSGGLLICVTSNNENNSHHD
jgi:hypothetical protein